MGRVGVATFFVLFAIASAGQLAAVADKNRPVSKVINILKNMIEQLEKEGEEDEEVYQGMSCWCSTNDEEKTTAITNGEQRDNDLTASIEELTANSARLNTEIANLNKEIAKNEEALDSATALRRKQLAEFNAEEKDMLQTITSLKGAVIAISKHHEGFLQTSKSDLEFTAMKAVVTIQHVLKKHADLLAEVLTPHQRKVVAALSQTQTAQPQSGEIFGILKAMKESFQTNLAQAQKEEAENLAGYNDLKTAKEEEIQAGREQSDSKTTELADTDEKNAQSKQDLDDTRNTLAADTEYLASLKETCRNADQEYEERTKTRQLEIGATSKALSFLSSDEAHDLFTKTLNFLQQGSAAQTAKRTQVVNLLQAAASKSQDPRLSTLAVNARVNGMDGVKKTISDMVEKLVQEKEDEIKHRDFCIEEIGQNERDTESKNRDKSDLEAEIDDLKMHIDELTRVIDELKAAIAEASLQLKHAGENREKANNEFQVVISDQRATQALLKKALDILKGFYDKAALVQSNAQASQPAGPPPPQGFKSYEKNKSSGGVMGMMQEIIDDAKTLEAEATRDEEQSQKAYEDFVTDTNVSLDDLNLSLINKSKARARAESDKIETETEHEGVVGELESLASSNSDLHKSCDYTLKNFDLRQTTRDDEVEALKQAIAIFSGASFGAFLEKMQ